MTLLRTIVVIMACVIASCAPKAEKPEATKAPQGLLARIDESNGYTQDEKGNWTPKTDKRSPFESKGKSPYFNSNYKGKSFNTESYAKKSWWGQKEMSRKAYQGKMEEIDHQVASVNGKQSNIRSNDYETGSYDKTGSYQTHAAIENDAATIGKPSDAETDLRRKTYIKPKITEYEQQRALTIEQSKKLLGN